jgi:hypothetical protein
MMQKSLPLSKKNFLLPCFHENQLRRMLFLKKLSITTQKSIAFVECNANLLRENISLIEVSKSEKHISKQ